MNNEHFSPKSFLKSRRPERFSDSVTEDIAELDRSYLEFHLDSLTSRSQETDFERFALKLCQREVCPNLLPQTGPTGGGDSKVDSETYPIADQLALTWFYGFGREASGERWAFAFSTKKDWVPKVRSDVNKISVTGRGYSKAFFVTNQTIRDQKRAEIEDELRDKHSIDVRIFDRTWILDRVFEGSHQTVAIEELKVTALSRPKVKTGPNDSTREESLAALEKKLSETLGSNQVNSAVVDIALDAAELSRSLEKSRAEIEGRFSRAELLAQRFGTLRQKVEVAYQWAWTLFWWFEDYQTFTKQYSVVEERVCGSRNAYDLERLTTLWYNLHGAIVHNALDREAILFEAHTETLLIELQRLSGEKDRPSTALQAQTMILEIELLNNLYEDKPVESTLRALKRVVVESKGLIGFPLDPLVNMLTEAGQVLEGVPDYDHLFDTIVEVVSSRDGEISAARLLLKKGKRLLFQKNYVGAISVFGRILSDLYKHETRHEVVQALYYCGCAYHCIDLLWAARGTFLSAASIATDEFWKYGDITPYQAACYRKLKDLELQLGRIPHVLTWHELDMVVRRSLVSRGYENEELLAPSTSFNALFIRLLLRTGFSDLEVLQGIPDILDNLGLDLEADALLYLLGYPDRIYELVAELNEEPDIYLSNFWNLQADGTLSEQPFLYDQSKKFAVMQSRILGCLVEINSEMSMPCIEVTESILAAVESFMATLILEQAIACEPTISINVNVRDTLGKHIEFSFEEIAGCPHLDVVCKYFDPHNLPIEDQVIVRDYIFQIAISICANIIQFKDLEGDLEILFRDQKAFERSAAFTTTIGTLSNVLGNKPKMKLELWSDDRAKMYPLLRTKPWKPIIRKSASHDKDELESARKEPNSIRHSQIDLFLYKE